MTIVLFAAPIFPVGRLVCTQGAEAELTPFDVSLALNRHSQADWGDCCPEDRKSNDEALKCGSRLFSVYHAENGTKFWIITEWDRSATTVLLPHEY